MLKYAVAIHLLGSLAMLTNPDLFETVSENETKYSMFGIQPDQELAKLAGEKYQSNQFVDWVEERVHYFHQ